MKIAMIGETRFPVLPNARGGLARSTFDIANQLMLNGHDVTLFAPDGSEFEGRKQRWELFTADGFDVGLDYSHNHADRGNAPILNLIGDIECHTMPNNAVVESTYMLDKYVRARKVTAGINVEQASLSTSDDNYLAFIGKDWNKQINVAQEVAKSAGYNLSVINGTISEADKWRILWKAKALLCPYLIDASPRSPLEAALCGTPTICLDADGTKEHVSDGVTGFVCNGVGQMVNAVSRLGDLDRAAVRSWVEKRHDIRNTIKEIEAKLYAVAGGERW